MILDPKLFPIGQRIADTKWVMCGVLGEGGMGIVLDVVKDPGIRGAMKMMQPRFTRRADLVDLFLNEIRMTTALRHQHIVYVIDADRLPDGTPFVVTERLDGITLRRALRKLNGKGLPANLVHMVGTQICDALWRAHSHTTPIVHRDLKPENIYLHQPSYEPPLVKVLDWGVAALVDGKNDVSGYMGTPLYMAPEQVRGQPVTPMVDIYATGLMLYEMLTGRMPWDIDYGRPDQVSAAHLSLAPIRPSRFAPWIPKHVEEHVLKALAKDPADRPPSAYAFSSELYELQFVDDGSGQPVTASDTVFTLSTVIDLSEGEPASRAAAAAARAAEATEHGMTAPPLAGRSLEPAAPGEYPPATRRPAALPDLARGPNETVRTDQVVQPSAFAAAGAPAPVARPVASSAPPQDWPAVTSQLPAEAASIPAYRWYRPGGSATGPAPRIRPVALAALMVSLCVAVGAITLGVVLIASGHARWQHSPAPTTVATAAPAPFPVAGRPTPVAPTSASSPGSASIAPSSPAASQPR